MSSRQLHLASPFRCSPFTALNVHSLAHEQHFNRHQHPQRKLPFAKLHVTATYSRSCQSSSKLTAQMESLPHTFDFDCEACLEPISMHDERWWRANCGHDYCGACIESFYRSSLSGGLFPPKCCRQGIPIYAAKRIRKALPVDLRAKLDEALEKIETSDRTYCFVPTCSSFIGLSHISGNDATCPVCQSFTCVACKAAAHAGACPTNEALQQVLQVAQHEGWKRCKRCMSMIERVEGCNDML